MDETSHEQLEKESEQEMSDSAINPPENGEKPEYMEEHKGENLTEDKNSETTEPKNKAGEYSSQNTIDRLYNECNNLFRLHFYSVFL